MRLELSQEEKDQLLKEYPFLGCNDYIGCDDFNLIDDVPSGWLNLVKEFLPKLKARLIEIGFLDDYKISQIKEKYGSLRWYDNTCDEVVMNLISELENKSEKTCVICGEPATYISKGWICPYCNDCKKEIEE